MMINTMNSSIKPTMMRRITPEGCDDPWIRNRDGGFRERPPRLVHRCRQLSRHGPAEHRKGFLVCGTLDALFNGLQAGGPRLLFKGGTSLSKAYGFIATLLGRHQHHPSSEMTSVRPRRSGRWKLSGKKRAARLDAIREACQNYINGPLLEQLSGLLRGLLETAKQAPELGRVEADP
jgi:hypothetical protein